MTTAMKWSWVFVGVFLSLGTLSWGEKGLEIPEYDGKDRVHDLNAKNYKSIMKKYDVMVIYYHKNVDGNRSATKQFQIEELALEVGLRQSMTVDGSVADVGEGSRWEEGKEGKGFNWRIWLQLGIPGCRHGFRAFGLTGNAAVAAGGSGGGQNKGRWDEVVLWDWWRSMLHLNHTKAKKGTRKKKSISGNFIADINLKA